jgi:hypothetical protein
VVSGYQLLVSRAKVTAGDEVLAERASVSVKNNVARFTANGQEHTMEVASIEKGRKVATVTGTDGTVWTVARAGCGCGGGR